MYYLKNFNSHSDYASFTGTSEFIKPNVSLCIQEKEVHYSPIPHDYSKDYLTFEALENNSSLYFRSTHSSAIKTISASTDNGLTWNEYTSSNSTQGTLIATLLKGQKILIKGNIITPQSGRGYVRFNGLADDGSLILYGNIMSLVYGDDFIGKTSMIHENTEEIICFGWVFESIKNLVSAENLILPATELTTNGYNGAYEGMFHNCTRLTATPELPATTLTLNCYYSMFEGCTSLTTGPELKATTLAVGCYQYMFQGCTSLNSITCLATDISATDCTSDWVNNVASNGTFTKAASMTNWTTDFDGIPFDWTVQDAS